MKSFLPLFLLLFFSTIIFGQKESLTLNYDSDKSTLTANHISQLDYLLQNISIDKIKNIKITGHTDTVANLIYNQELSKKRATSVQNYFLSKNVSPHLIQISWQGETQAISPNNLLEDRRVVIEVSFPIEKKKTIEEKIILPPTPEPEPITPVSELFKQLKPQIQEFCIYSNKDTIIRCASGTIISIKENSFQLNHAQRKSKSCIRFQVREVFSYSKMVMENLTTTSDGQILETQGMIYTNAILDDDTLSLQKDIAIMLPIDEVRNDAKIFDGERDPHSDVMNWTVNNNSVLRNFNVNQLADCLKYNELWKDCRSINEHIKVNEDQTAECIKQLLYCNNQKGCTRCKFNCRIKRFGKPFKGIFNKGIRKQNKELRSCQRILRKSERYLKKGGRKRLKALCLAIKASFKGKKIQELSEREKEILALADKIEQSDNLVQNGLVNTNLIKRCDELDKLFKEYQVTNIEDLLLAVNQPLMDEFGVQTMEALLDTLPKVNLEKLEVAYRNETISFEDYKFYVFNTSSFGWKNVDIFINLKKKDMAKLKINLSPSPEVDCKLILQERSFVLPAKLSNDSFYFDEIPKNEKGWIVAIKYKQGQPMLAMKKIITANDSVDLEFEALSLEELKLKLKELDF